MATNGNKIKHKTSNSSYKCAFNSNSEDDLIDLDKELPTKLHSNWLIECNGNSPEFQDSFSKLHFSNPYIKEMVNSVYQSGKSKQVLHHLLYFNDKMAMSCDNCAYLYRNTKPGIIHNDHRTSIKRHSVAVTSLTENVMLHSSGSSLADSLDSLTIADHVPIVADNNGNSVNIFSDRMTQSSITDYDRTFCAPTESSELPTVKCVSTSQNVLSRTYDKEDLEILKQTELSQSVFVPHISGSKIDHYSEIEFNDKSKMTSSNQRHSFARGTLETPSKSSYLKRISPISTTGKMNNEFNYRPRPTSAYQIDKLTKSTIDRCIKMSQVKQSNFNSKRLLNMNEHLLESDVLTPINSPRNVKHFLASNQHSRLKRPNTTRR